MITYDVLPFERYMELYTSRKTASKFMEFEECVLKQQPLLIQVTPDSEIELKWCECDEDGEEGDYTGLAILYELRRNAIVIAKGLYYDDSFYSLAIKEGLRYWADTIINKATARE